MFQIFPKFSPHFPRFSPDFLQIFSRFFRIYPRFVPDFFSCPIYIQVQLWIQANHGAPGNSKGKRHVGDLGNIQAENGKEASIDITDSIISLWGERSIIGRAIVVHEDIDDLGLGGDEGSITTGKVIIHKSSGGGISSKARLNWKCFFSLFRIHYIFSLKKKKKKSQLFLGWIMYCKKVLLSSSIYLPEQSY